MRACLRVEQSRRRENGTLTRMEVTRYMGGWQRCGGDYVLNKDDASNHRFGPHRECDRAPDRGSGSEGYCKHPVMIKL